MLLGEYDSQNQPLLEHVYLGSTPIAVMKGEDVYDVHTDHLGTPRVVSSSQGDVVWSWEPMQGVGVDSLPFVYNLRHPGQYADGESGLYYNHFRSYNPAIGRYVESDPIGLAATLCAALIELSEIEKKNPQEFLNRIIVKGEPVDFDSDGDRGNRFGLEMGRRAGRYFKNIESVIDQFCWCSGPQL